LLGGYVWVVRTGFFLDRGGHLAPLTEPLPGGHGRAGAVCPRLWCTPQVRRCPRSARCRSGRMSWWCSARATTSVPQGRA